VVELTRPYGDVAPAPEFATDLSLLIQAPPPIGFATASPVTSRYQHPRQRLGPLARHPHPVSQTFAVAACNVAVALPLVGSACFAFAARELEGHWNRVGVHPRRQPLRRHVIVTQRLAVTTSTRGCRSRLLMVLFVVPIPLRTVAVRRAAAVAVGQSQWIATLTTTSLISSRPRRAPLFEVTR